MKLPISCSTSNNILQHVRLGFTLALVGSLYACGGGLGNSGSVPYTGTGFNARELPAEFTARHAVNYSPFRSNNRDTETPTAAQIKEDMDLLIEGNIKLIRLFDSGDKTAKLILEVIQDNNLDMKMQLGIWISGITSNNTRNTAEQNQEIIDNAKASNEAEIARGIKLANDFCPTKTLSDPSCIVLAIGVGNEQMVNWSSHMEPSVMAGYVKKVRDQVVQPVTSDDDWAFWAERNANDRSPVPVLEVIDYVAMHTYPMSQSEYNQWAWRQEEVPEEDRAAAMMNAALARAKADYTSVRSNIDKHGRIDLPIIIGETGWRAENTYFPDMTFRANTVNQKMYYSGLRTWRLESRGGNGPANIFAFEAFDEPWKKGDDKWGLFNVAREARCAVAGLSSSYTAEAGSCAEVDAVYWQALTKTTVDTSQFTIFADSTPASSTIYWNGWDGWATIGANDVSTLSGPVDGGSSKELAPTPKNWGWGLALMMNDPSQVTTQAADLSQFGYLNFSVKTDYPGKLEIGFVTGSGSDSSSYEVFINLESGKYGYYNDDTWHTVQIPISDITAAAIARSGKTDSKGNSIDLTAVTQPFIIADRYTNTGNIPAQTNKIYIDNIYWAN